MAGDEITATSQYYYQNAVTNTTGNTLATDVLTMLINSILGSSSTGLAKGNTTNISNQLNVDPYFINQTNPSASDPAGTNPKAYMTIMFFDERFNFVSEGSTAVRVLTQGDNAAPLVLANIKSPKNGYAYVYLSNESNEPVYFDNFKVGDNRGRIIEEDHYYSFGLKIAGISSKKLPDPNEGNVDNKHLYNDKELWDDADLNWYDYGFRNYDPQIGRFPQLDPLTDDYPHYTPFQYAGNEPIANVDLDGLEEKLVIKGLETVGTQTGIVTAKSFMKEISYTVIKKGAVKAAPKLVKSAIPAAFTGLRAVVGVINFLNNQSTGPGSTQQNGTVFTSKIGQLKDGEAKSDYVEPQPISIDMMMDMFNMATKELKPDFSHVTTYPDLLNKVLEVYQDVVEKSKTSTVPKKFDNDSKNKNDNPKSSAEDYKNTADYKVLRKKGNIVFDRGSNFNREILNSKGDFRITSKRATDTFPKQRSYGYLYPLDK